MEKTNKALGYWKKIENQAHFLNEVAKKLGVKTPKDWGNISITTLKEHGGSSLLSKYRNNLFATLKNAYPEMEWEIEWFKKKKKKSLGFWKEKKNQRAFFDDLQNKFKIKKPSDWGKISGSKVIKEGGGMILFYYGNSLWNCLNYLYPEIQWKVEWFRLADSAFWKHKSNQKNFFDDLGKSIGIKKPSDWGKVHWNTVAYYPGGHAILEYYGTTFSALKSVFPDVSWKQEWFNRNPKYSRYHWNFQENRKKFMDNIASQYGLENILDWKKLSIQVIRKHGGQGLLNRYNNSLIEALYSIYDCQFFHPYFESSNQITVLNNVNELFGKTRK